jgi:hypothetical protein
MIIIKRFIDKVSATRGNTLVLPIEEAKMLRDEIAKLITENYDLLNSKVNDDNAVMQLEINGGRF